MLDPFQFNENIALRTVDDNAAVLRQKVNAVIRFGRAPDGLPTILDIQRETNPQGLANTIREFCGDDETLPEREAAMAHELEEYVQRRMLARGIVFLFLGDLRGDHYLCGKPLAGMAPRTVLAQVLGEISPLDRLYQPGQMPRLRGTRPATAVQHACAEPTRATTRKSFAEKKRELEEQKHIALSLADGVVHVVSVRQDEPEEWEYGPVRKRRAPTITACAGRLVEEDLQVFAPRFCLERTSHPPAILQEGDWQDREAYAGAALIAANEGPRNAALCLRITAAALARQFVSLLGRLQDMHGQGLVHGDLKPPNILTTADGLVPFDPLCVPSGEFSPGLTMNYCAPEQVLARPVTPATDVYNAGLMLLALTGGCLFGGLREYALPVGRSALQRAVLLGEPDVFLDPTHGRVEPDGIAAWRKLLLSCLAFDPQHRLPDAAALATELDRLLEEAPLRGELTFQPDFGRLSLMGGPDGNPGAAWALAAE